MIIHIVVGFPQSVSSRLICWNFCRKFGSVESFKINFEGISSIFNGLRMLIDISSLVLSLVWECFFIF